MALKISTISRKPWLVWRGALSDMPGGWGPLVRALQADYLIGAEHVADVAAVPADLQALIGRSSNDPQLTVDLLGPGRGAVPAKGYWLHLPIWDFSTLPEPWQVPVLNGADGFFAASETQRDGFIRDGLPADRLAVLTPGVDLAVMIPDGPKVSPAGVEGRYLLFIGDLTWNSGIDNVLKAFAAEFVANEGVSLVILDVGLASETNRAAALDQLAALQGKPDAPPVLRLPLPQDAAERAALIRSAEALIYQSRDVAHPWPVVEAMACGVPVIVPAEGPARTFVPDAAGWFAAGRATVHTEARIGDIPTLGTAAFYDVTVEEMRRYMRHVFEHPEEAADKRAAAREAAVPFGWDQVLARFAAFAATVSERPLVRERLWELQVAFGKANELFVAQDYAGARKLLEPYMDMMVSSPDVYSTYGASVLFTGNQTKAIAAFVRAIELNDQNANYYNLIGVALFQLNEYPLARRFFLVALAINPQHAGATDSLKETERKLLGKSAKNRDRVSPPYRHLEVLLGNVERLKAKPVRLSVSMIVKNEEKFLAKCLASIKDVADEIVVVDTGSTDRTVEIAESFGATMGHFDWTGDFSDARNAALDLCTGDWILALDADEELLPSCAANLRALISRPTSAPTLYLPRIINLISGNDADAIEHYAPRIFPRMPNIRWVGRIHEQVVDVQNDKKLDRSRVPDVVLHHHGYSPEVMLERGKDARNMALLEQSIAEDPDSAFHQFNMGVALRVGDGLNEAIPFFRKAIEICDRKGETPMFLAAAYNYLIASLVSAGRAQEALDVAGKCELFCRDQPDYWLNLGVGYDRLERYEDAIKAFQRCMDLRHSSSPLLADRGAMTWKPYAGMGSAYIKLGEVEKGERYMRMSLKENPKNVELRRMLLRNAVMRQEYDRVEADLKAYIEEIQGPDVRVVYQDLANLYFHQNRHDAAIEVLEGALSRAREAQETAGAVSDLARIYQLTGHEDKALALMEQHQLSPGVFEELGQVYCQHEDWTALDALCEKLLASGIGDAFAYAHRGIVRFKRGDQQGAEADFRHALELNPDDAESWNNLGVAALAREQVDEAEGYYLKALERRPTMFSTNLDLAKIAIHRQDAQVAYPYLQKALEAIPTDPGALSLAAEAATALGEMEAGEAHLMALINAEPADSNHWVRLGYHYLGMNEPQAALRVLGEALEMTREQPNEVVYSALGVTLLELGKFEDARNAFILAVHLSPNDTQAIQGLQLADKLCTA